MNKKLLGTRLIVYLALFTAIAAVLNLITIFPVKHFAITFTSIPCFFAGIFLGPFYGFFVGLFGDILGSLFSGQIGSYIPIIGFASGMFGFVPGIVQKFIRVDMKYKIMINYILCFIICTTCLNTVGLWLYFGQSSFLAYLAVRLPFQLANSLINIFAAMVMYKSMVELLPKALTQGVTLSSKPKMLTFQRAFPSFNQKKILPNT